MASKSFSNADRADLGYAKNLLEHPSLAARIANAVGTPIEKGLELLPQSATAVISAATNKSIEAALRFAIKTANGARAAIPVRIPNPMPLCNSNLRPTLV